MGGEQAGPTAGSVNLMTIAGESEPVVTVAIVTWNSAKYLPGCLAGIASQTYPNLDLIVVDNASSDGSAGLVREMAPEAALVENQTNEGYSRGHNLAIGATEGRYYLSLNPDIELDPNYVGVLVEALEVRPEYGSVVGKLWLPERDSEGRPALDGAGLFIDRRRHQYLRGHGEADVGQYDRAEEVFGVDGAAPLYRRSMLEDAQMQGEVLDHNFFAYMEDIDLAWRARILGWKAWYEPEATAAHDRSFRPGHRHYMPRDLRRLAVKNRYLMLLKNEAGAPWRRDWWRLISYDLRIWMYVLLLEQSSLGALGLLRQQWSDTLNWRKEISSRARVRPEDRLGWFR